MSDPRPEPGSDPDPRFTFANERTFLAWNRTALALIATGLGVAQFLKLDWAAAPVVIGVALMGLGAVIAVMSFRGWEARERAMRLGEPLPPSRLPALVALGVGAVAVVAGILAVIDALKS